MSAPSPNCSNRSSAPGGIYTHCYSPFRQELLSDGTLNPAMRNGRKRGVIFDVGHGGGSFFWNIAVPATKQGFLAGTPFPLTFTSAA
ncbi:MAG: hypothetical protein U5J83_19460 [Bryobacterales bacterium]|nr:hypothetical protein [Bryobacterales bacterium]